VSLQRRFLVYLIAIHVVFAGTAFFLLRDRPIGFLAVEVAVVVSFAIALRLLSSLFRPLEIIRSGVDFLASRDFNTRFPAVDYPELGPLVDVYNRMAEHLREERIRGEEQERFLGKILQVRPSGVITFDLDGRITRINPGAEEMLDVGRGEAAGRRLAELASPFALALGDLEIGETRVVPLRGRRRIKCQKMAFTDRGFSRAFVVLEELTEELRRSERASYEKLIRMMSHEVNNTSGSVTSLLRSCRRYAGQVGEVDREDFEHAIDVAVSRTEGLNRFMSTFADVIRLPAPAPEPTSVQALLEESRTLFQDECVERNVQWVQAVDETIPPVLLDPAQMQQVLVNVVRNALEAIGENGEIHVEYRRRRGRAVLVIEDTGGGVPPEVRDQLFSPFYTSKSDGQGIGLTVVAEILQGHDLDFSLEDAGEGRAAFSVVFP
jgi:nitrogen fixation/metabolism regulation signal transduction histidine kinase